VSTVEVNRHFQHSTAIWRDFPDLAAGVMVAAPITDRATVDRFINEHSAIAESRLTTASEGSWPEIQAWRRAFSSMGLKPTQYRCASEALLRRFKREEALPLVHPLVDRCNAISMAFGIPVAVFDLSRITGSLEVGYATGDEIYLTFSGETEHPQPHEVIFADESGRAHARRWTNRQSGYSAVREETTGALVVAEALHATAAADVANLMNSLAHELNEVWSVTASPAILSQASPRFQFGA
jgi:DNA/RNA-binding domain of Phe-tRNA-synthetase-like protein